MALQLSPARGGGFVIGPQDLSQAFLGGGSIGSAVTFTFNAAGDKAAFIFTADAFTLDQWAWQISSFTSTGTLDITIEALDASGDPTGTGLGTLQSLSVASTGVKAVSGINYALTQGTSYAVVMTAAAGFGGNFVLHLGTGSSTFGKMNYCSTKDTAGAWTRSSTRGWGRAFAIGDASGFRKQQGLCGPSVTVAAESYQTGTNPKERGNRFVLPFACRIIGFSTAAYGGASPPDFTAKIYSDILGTPVQEATTGAKLAVDHVVSIGGGEYYFTAPFTPTINTPYGLAIQADSANNVNLPVWSVGSNTYLDTLFSKDFYKITRNGATAFSTSDALCYALFPIVDQLSDNVSSGGGAAPFVQA